MTILQIVNRVLRRLREDTVAALNETDYSYMVCEMLNDIHLEMLKHDWSSMDHIIDVPVDASQRGRLLYELSQGVDRCLRGLGI